MEESEFPDLQKKPEVKGFWHKDSQFPGYHEGSSGNSPGESSLRTGLDWLSVVAKETTLKPLVAQTTSQCSFGLAGHFCRSYQGSVWGCGYLLGQPVSGLGWDGWDSLFKWSFVPGFLHHGRLRVLRRQAPVPKHVIWLFACIMFAEVSLAKVSHMVSLSVNAGEAHTCLSVPMRLMQWVSYCCPLPHTLDFTLL